MIVTGLGDHEQLTRQMYPCSRDLWVIKEDFIFTSLLMPSHGILMVFKHSREATWPSATLMGMLKRHKIMITVHLILAGTLHGDRITLMAYRANNGGVTLIPTFQKTKTDSVDSGGLLCQRRFM